METDRYWENERVQYVGGIALPKEVARITGHGWIEHDGRVVELTWPWYTPVPPEDAVYFGRPVTREELRDSWARSEYGPYLLNSEGSRLA